MNNTPLVEIIAEMRWGEGNPKAPALLATADDSAYIKLGIEVGKLGYHQLERVVPEGFPVSGGTVVYRYRNVEKDQNTLYQLGPGIFSINGLPPYNSWEGFLPVIRNGLDALWAVCPISQDQPIFLSLIYLDAFTKKHLGGMASEVFFKEIVGISNNKPESLVKFGGGSSATSMRFMQTQKAEDGRELVIDVAEGTLSGEYAIVMNTIAKAAQFKAAGPQDILANFAVLHDMLHEVFFEMIRRNADLYNHMFKPKE